MITDFLVNFIKIKFFMKRLPCYYRIRPAIKFIV